MTAPDETVLRAALTEKLESLIAHHRREASHSLGKYGVEHSAKAEAFRQVLELVAALAGRFVDDTHHCAKCGIRWTGVAGAVYCGDCHRAALTGRPEATEPKCIACSDGNHQQCLGSACSCIHDPAEAGRPDADPVCPRCKRPISEIADRLTIEREDAAARGPFAPGAGGR